MMEPLTAKLQAASIKTVNKKEGLQSEKTADQERSPERGFVSKIQPYLLTTLFAPC